MNNKDIPNSREVAIYGYDAMIKGKAVAIYGIKNYIMANLSRFFPRSFVVSLVRKIQEWTTITLNN